MREGIRGEQGMGSLCMCVYMGEMHVLMYILLQVICIQ